MAEVRHRTTADGSAILTTPDAAVTAAPPPAAVAPAPPATGQVLYEDKYLTLDTDGIKITWYYFPTFTSKRIRYTEMTSFHTAQQLALKWYQYKEWGMGLSWIWWACGRRSQLLPTDPYHQLIITVAGCKIQSGATMENPDQVLAILRERAPHANPTHH